MTLIEVMVAVIILAVAGVAMIRLQSQSTETLQRLEQNYFAGVIAENRMVDKYLSPVAPSLAAVQQGKAHMSGYEYLWTENYSETNEAGFVRVDINIKTADSGQGQYELSGFFRAR